MRFRRMEALAAVHPWKGAVLPVTVTWVGIVSLSLLGGRVSTQGILAILLLGIGWASRADFRLWGKSVGVASGFAMVGCLGLLVGWDPHRSALVWSPGGADRALVVLGRTVVCSAATLWWVQTIPFSRVLDLLWRMGVSRTLLELVCLVHRAILVLDDSLGGIQRGMESRNGFALARRRGHSVRVAITALFSRAQAMAQRQEVALASRGGEGGWTVLHREVAWMPLATAGAVVGVGAVGAALAVWERFHVP